MQIHDEKRGEARQSNSKMTTPKRQERREDIQKTSDNDKNKRRKTKERDQS